MVKNSHFRWRTALKRILSLILAICLLSSLLTVSFADSETPDTNSTEEDVSISIPEGNSEIDTTPADEETPDVLESGESELAPGSVEDTGTGTMPVDSEIPAVADTEEDVSASAPDEDTETDTTPADEVTAYTPTITTQPEGFHCAKNNEKTLTVVAAPAENSPDAAITYQWQKSTSASGDFQDILGATSSTFTPPTDTTGTMYYRCVVTATDDNSAYSVESDIAECKVGLDDFVVIMPLCSFKATSKKNFTYTTEYYVGNKFVDMYIGLPVPATDTQYVFEVFHGTTAAIEEAEIYNGVSKAPTRDASASGTLNGVKYYGYYFRGGADLTAGEHYIFLRATLVDKNNPDIRSNSIVESIKLTYTHEIVEEFKWPKAGEGTENAPYLITEVSDLEYIRTAVNEWDNRLTGMCFKFDADITLPEGWTPIGGKTTEGRRVFSGQIDGGGHKLTVAAGGKPLLNLVSNAVIKNLNIYGEKINGCGLIDDFFIDYGDGIDDTSAPPAVTMENVRLLEGSSTLRSGFMSGSGSGANTITLRNCEVESGVIIGYGGNVSGIGSFVGGDFNGQMENCYSAATVKGANQVGGLAGRKGQSMGECSFTNCGFTGTIEATGNWVGGIIGEGYTSDSAPSTKVISFNNCYVKATISGNDYVGGIIGCEGGIEDTWNPCILSNSTFYGTINSTGQYVGGIIGYYNAVNKYQDMENNYFCELTEGRTLDVIGKVGSYNIGTGRNPFASQTEADEWYANTGKAIKASEYKAEDVVGLLNSGSSSLQNWVVGEKSGFPDHSTDPVLIRLKVNGTWPNQQEGQDLNDAGITYTAVWSDGREAPVSPSQVTIEGYDKTKTGRQTLTAKYGTARAEFNITVLRKEGTITVKFALYGDTAHGTPTAATGTHTLVGNNLEKWIPLDTYTISTNDTVLKLLEKAITTVDPSGSIYKIDNTDGNYVASISKGDITLGEFTNGSNSGWMFTVNGVHGDFAASEQFLNNGETVIFHYTDDYTAEKSSSTEKPGDDDNKPTGDIATYKSTLTSALAYLKEKVPNPTVSSTSGEWAVLAQARGNALDNAAKQAYLTNLWIYADNRNGKLSDVKYTDYSRVVLALTSVGVDATAFTSGNKTYNLVRPLLDANYTKVSEQGNNGTAFALIALDSGNYLNTDDGKKARAAWIDALAETQFDDGSWSIDPSDKTAAVSDRLDITAMVVQALAPYYKDSSKLAALGTMETGYGELTALVDKAVSWLKQQGANGYSSCEAAAQMVVAMTALGDGDGADAALTSLLGFQVGNTGSFCKKAGSGANQMSTEQATYALVAYDRYKNNQNSLYNMADKLPLSTSDLDLVRTITVVCGDGGTVSPATTMVQKGKDVVFTITADAGYEIKDVTVAGKSVKGDVTNGKYTIKNVTTDQTLSATFEKVSGAYGIKTSCNEGGYISPTSATVLEGDSKTFYITPYDGYKIKDVKVGGVSQGAITSYTFKDVKADQTITAIFEPSNGITVYFTLKGDTNHGSSGGVHTYSGGGLSNWINRQEVTVSKGATVYDVFTKVLNQYGYRYIGAESNYVETIITPSGQQLSEFTNGRLSGWMYSINGTYPELGLKEQQVYNGNEIIWHYTDDYTKEKGGVSTSTTTATQITPTVSGSTATVSSSDLSSAITSAINNGTGMILIAPQGSSTASTLTVNLPTSTLYSAISNGVGVTIQSGAGTVNMSSYALAGIANVAGGTQLNITTTIKNAQQGVNLLSGRSDVTAAQLSNSSVTEVTMTSGSQIITNWGGRAITLSLPVSSTNFTAGNRYTVYQVSANGSVEVLTGYCSRQNGTLQVEVTTTHLSTFVVVPESQTSTTNPNASTLPFLDVSTTDWFYNEVSYVYNRGLFNGDSPTAFLPYGYMNRAMLVTVLHRYEGQPSTTGTSGFNDVASGQWYSNGVAWANSTGVVNGKGSGRFAPFDNITREEIAVILYRYAKIKSWDVSASTNLSTFSDGAKTSDWAMRAMQWANAKGIINGKGNGVLDPSGYATRAEVAAMLMRFIQSY